MGVLDRLPVPRPAAVGEEALRDAVAGRSVLVTGASSGIGAAAAKRLGGAGARVLLTARREEELHAVADEVDDAVVLPCDLADEGSCAELVARATELGVDVLVSNAGHSILRSVAGSKDAPNDARRLMEINYLGPVRLIAGLLDELRERRGQVVSVSSIAVQAGTPGFAAYAASKTALDAYTRAVAQERAAKGIAFTTINMPLVKTPMTDPSDELMAEMASLEPEQAAALVASAIVHRPRRIGTAAGELAAFGWAVDPAVASAVDRRLRSIPGSGGGSGDGGGRRSVLGRLSHYALTRTIRR